MADVVDVLYEGWVVAAGVAPRAEGGDLFVPTDAPMPFGTRVVVRHTAGERALYVTRVDETVSAGMLLSMDPAPRGPSKVEKDGPKPSPAPPPTSVTEAAKDAGKADAPVAGKEAPGTKAEPAVETKAEVAAAKAEPADAPKADGGKPEPELDDNSNKKRRGRSRKPTLT